MQGIYEIKNIKTNTVYIGSSKNIEHRLKTHRRNLEKNQHINKHLQYAWNVYGVESFVFETLQLVDDPSQLLLIEEQYIELTRHNQYNFSSVPSAPMTGKTLTKEQKDKIGRVHKGKLVSDETKRRISTSKRNVKLSDDHRWNIFYTSWKRHGKLTLDNINEILLNETKNSITVMSLSKEYNISFRKMWNILNGMLEHSDSESIKMKYKNRKQSYLSLANKFNVTSDRIKNVVETAENYKLLLKKEHYEY